MYIFNAFYLLHSYNQSFLISLCFDMVSFRGQKKLGLGPDRSDEHPHPFHMRIPPQGPFHHFSHFSSLLGVSFIRGWHLFIVILLPSATFISRQCLIL